MKTIFIMVLVLGTFQVFGRSDKKYHTCVYSKDTMVKDLLYKIPKGELELKLKITQRRAQEKCMGVTTTNRYPDNGINNCLIESNCFIV